MRRLPRRPRRPRRPLHPRLTNGRGVGIGIFVAAYLAELRVVRNAIDAQVDLDTLDLGGLADWLIEQTWFDSNAGGLSQVGLIGTLLLAPDQPQLHLLLVEARFDRGRRQVYRVPIVIDDRDELPEGARIAAIGDAIACDLLAERRDPPRLLATMAVDGWLDSVEEDAASGWCGARGLPADSKDIRPTASGRFDTSLALGDSAILKVYRRIETGINPEVEMLNFFGDHEFRSAPALLGWYEHRGSRTRGTLASIQQFAGGRGGWEMTVEGLRCDRGKMLGRLRALGYTVGAMHATLASDPISPAFAPEVRGAETLHLFAASLDDKIERFFLKISEDERFGRIAHRGQELRDRLRGLAGIEGVGMAIRVHGDLHLGQTLLCNSKWTIRNFDGDQYRPGTERRAKRSPLRDVAVLLRSLASASVEALVVDGREPTAGLVVRGREYFLDGYLDIVKPTLLPPRTEEIDQLLQLYELDRALDELSLIPLDQPRRVEMAAATISQLLQGEVQ